MVRGMKPPSTIMVPCPMCKVVLVVPMGWSGTREVTVTVDRSVLTDHAALCPARGTDDGDAST